MGSPQSLPKPIIIYNLYKRENKVLSTKTDVLSETFNIYEFSEYKPNSDLTSTLFSSPLKAPKNILKKENGQRKNIKKLCLNRNKNKEEKLNMIDSESNTWYCINTPMDVNKCEEGTKEIKETNSKSETNESRIDNYKENSGLQEFDDSLNNVEANDSSKIIDSFLLFFSFDLLNIILESTNLQLLEYCKKMKATKNIMTALPLKHSKYIDF